MVDIGVYKNVEFTREQFEKALLPRLFQTQASLLFYQGNRLVAANDYFFEEFDYDERNAEQVNAKLWGLPNERQRFQKLVEAVIAGEKIENFDFVILDGKGKKKHVRIQFGHFQIKGQPPICGCILLKNPIPFSFEDEFKNGREDLFRVIAEQSLNGIGLINDRFELIYMNPAGLAIYGYDSLDEAQKVPIIKTIAPESLASAIERSKNWLEDKPNPPTHVYKIIRKDGEIRDLEVMSGSIFLGGRKCHLNSFIDITDRMRAENALRKAASEWRTTFDTMANPVMLLDTEYRIVRANRAFAETVKLSFEEMLGKKCYECVHGTDSPPDCCPCAEIRPMKDERFEIYEPKLRRHFLVTTSPIFDESGDTTGCVHAMHDITEIKQAEEERRNLEEQLRQSQKMEAVGRLAGGIAHDFNNLLAIMKSYSAFLMEEIKDEALQEDLKIIRDAIARGTMLTRQLLAFSRKETIKPIIIDLNIVIKNLLKMLVRLIGEDIELVAELEKDPWPVRVDPGQVEQILVNLAANARDAMPMGGKLTICTKNVYLQEDDIKEHIESKPGPYVMLTVSDTGVGIDEETRSQVFEPFFTTKGIGKGSGLGLSTVYGIVKQNSGDIKVFSEVGKGTTFKIWLPKAKEKFVEPTVQEEKLPKPLGGSETILLVEDERGLLKIMKRTLAQKGYTVLGAASGDEAINVCQQHTGPIHLMVTDVIMPGMSGREVADRLACMRPGMKVLFVSGYTDDVLGPKGVLDSSVPFIQKPFSPDDLLSKVREMLDES